VLEAEHRYRTELVDAATPEKVFERRWAIALLDAAMSRLEGEFALAGKGPLFRQLAGWLVDGVEHRPYAEMAAELGLHEDAARKAVQRLRQSFRKAVREEIARRSPPPVKLTRSCGIFRACCRPDRCAATVGAIGSENERVTAIGVKYFVPFVQEFRGTR
jgi:hypothetical protein